MWKYAQRFKLVTLMFLMISKDHLDTAFLSKKIYYYDKLYHCLLSESRRNGKIITFLPVNLLAILRNTHLIMTH